MTTKNPSRNLFSLSWDFFASVKLALFTLCTISLASILGTVVPQKESLAWYAKKFSPQIAQFIDLFNLSDMFGSIWFKALLGLLSANLIICSIDRFPSIWKQIRTANLTITLKRLTGIKRNAAWTISEPPKAIIEHITRLLLGKGWKTSSHETENGLLLFSEKAAWSRLGVFAVHASILVILIGAILGAVFGFKGSALIPEGQSITKIMAPGTTATIDLGFEVRCDAFNIDFYQNGMPKEYRSDLTILEKGREILHRSIKVNAPLTYKGVTFYQSSYEGYRDFIVTLTDTEDGIGQTFMAPFQQQLEWKAKQVRFGIINAETSGDRARRVKIWFADENGEPTVFWLDIDSRITVERQGKKYLLFAKQMYATGLQVAMDPGVWWVYCGFGMLLIGLFTAFFISHRKIWVLVSEKNGKTSIFVAGSANKNKSGFDAIFSELAENLKNIQY